MGKYEDAVRDACVAAGLPEPEREFRFHDVRLYRFDCAWPEHKLAVEIHGGTASGGRHVSPSGMKSDCDKANLALLLGWRVLTFTQTHIGSKIGMTRTVSVIAAALRGANPPWHLANPKGKKKRKAKKRETVKAERGMFDG